VRAVQPSLLWLQLAFVALAAATYHLGFVRPPRVGAWRLQAAFLVTICLLIPAVAYTLVLQAGARERLAGVGIVPHPAIRHAVGIAAGQGERPVWVFTAAGDGAGALEFYDDPATRPGWEILERGPLMTVLGRDGTRLSVTAADAGTSATLIYFMVP
jgi:hypothetical protein